MPLESHSRLGPYEILGLLGVGGMGELYRARDTRLGREVAIKILASPLVSSHESRARFEREARAISNLSHPHICALYDIGHEDDLDYLVMELLAGETLSERIARGPIPFAEVLRIGAEIASALAAAHAGNIVHRDLKPANVMLTRSGAKLLDFGLARAFPTGAAGVGLAPTAAVDLTQEGTILGTLPYMAPEQLEGKPADARSDMFAFGALLFEMATGRRAFTATSHAALVSAILSSDPPRVSSLRPESSPLFDRVVARCLAKDPEARWESAHDLAMQLADASEKEADPAAATPVARQSSLWLVGALGGMILILAGVLWFRPAVRSPVRAGTVRLTVMPPPANEFFRSNWSNAIALSPDGSQLAFVARDSADTRRIWIRALSAAEPRELAGSEDATSIFWSPDGQAIAFFADGLLKRIAPSGGAAISLCAVSPVGDCSGTWGKHGDILFAPHQEGPIYRVPATGGTPSVLIRSKQERLAFPWFLPDGRRFLCFARRDDGRDSLMFVAPGGVPRGILAGVSMAQFVDPDYLIFVRDGALLGQRFEASSGRLTGAAFAIAPSVSCYTPTGWAAFATSSSGTLAYASPDGVDRVMLLDRRGRELGAVASPGFHLDLAIAPGGRRGLFSRRQVALGTYDLWTFDFERGIETRLTSDPRSEFAGVWLPGGRSIVYSSAQGGPPFHLTLLDLETARDSDLLPTRHFQTAQDVSPDGRTLLYTERTNGRDDIWQFPLSGGGKPATVLSSTSLKSGVRFSPDGHYLAFMSDESGRFEAYVVPFPGPGEKVRISRGGVLQLRWNRAAHEIDYLSADRRFWAVPVRTSPSLQIGAPTVLFELKEKQNWVDFDLMPDGQRILAIVPRVVEEQLPLSVVVNWADGVDR